MDKPKKERSSVPVPKKIPANNKQGYKWKLVIEGPPDPITGERKQIPRVRDTQSAVKAACKERYDELAAGMGSKKAKKMTFEQAAKEWLRLYAKTGVKETTVEARFADLDALYPYIGNVLVSTFKHNQYQKIINKMDDDGYKMNSIKKMHSAANMVFKWIIKEEIRKDNPCTGVNFPKKQRTVEDIRDKVIYQKYLDREELNDFLDALEKHGEDDDLETFYFLLFSGSRPGELCALEWPDITMDINECYIYKTIFFPRKGNGRFALTPPKTEKSIRKFYLDDFIINMLGRLKVKQTERHKLYKENYDDFVETNFIITNPNGTPFRPGKVINRMDKILKHTNIKKRATPHIFRHTHITMLIEASIEAGSQIDLKTIMERVGHDDSKTTLDIYTHVTEKMKQHNADLVKISFESLLNRQKSYLL